MNRKFVAASVLLSILMLGVMTYSITVFGYGFKRLESFKSLPENKQTLIIETMESVHTKNSGVREEILAAKQALTEVLTAPEFDEEAFQVNVDKMNDLHDQMFLSVTSAIKEVAPHNSTRTKERCLQRFLNNSHSDLIIKDTLVLNTIREEVSNLISIN